MNYYKRMPDYLKRLRGTNAELSEENGGLRETNTELSEENGRLRGTNTELSEENEGLMETNTELSEENGGLRGTNTELTEEVTKLKGSLGAEKERHRAEWRRTCQQFIKYDDLWAEKEQKILDLQH